MTTWSEIADKEGDVRSVTLTVQQQYLFFILMLLCQRAPALFISDIDESNTEEINDFIDSCIYAIMNEEIPPPVLGAMSEVNLLGHEAVVQGGGSALNRGVLSTQMYNMVVQPTTPALNWKVRWDRYLAAGQYSYSFLYNRIPTNGVIDVYATPDSGGTVTIINDADLRGTSLPNQFIRGTFTLTKSELYHIELEVVATTSGSNFNAAFTMLQLWRTGP